jgi:hypothetical protein
MFRKLFSLALLVLAVPGLASATSQFTVQNNSNDTIKFQIFDGDDSVCLQDAKSVNVDGNSSKSISCTGGGKQRCRVAVSVPLYDDDEACVESQNITSSCGSTAGINVDDGKTLVIESNYDYCAIQ